MYPIHYYYVGFEGQNVKMLPETSIWHFPCFTFYVLILLVKQSRWKIVFNLQKYWPLEKIHFSPIFQSIYSKSVNFSMSSFSF